MTCRRLLGISVREREREIVVVDNNCETNFSVFYSSQIVGVIVQMSLVLDQD